MTFLPIVERELRVAARRRGTYWMRTGVALAVIGIGMWIYLMESRYASPARLSRGMFTGLTVVAGLFCLTAGARATADSLSEEKRDGTLGLLFLTDLRGYDVVTGKLVAGSLNTFYGLLATLPVLAIPLLMGGVSGGEFWRITIVLLNTLFFSLAAGMFASAVTRSSRNAIGLCMLIVLGLAALLPLLAVILSATVPSRYGYDNPTWLLVPSPGYAFAMAFSSNYRGNEATFLVSLLITHGLTWACLIAACLIVPRSWQDRAATVTQLRWRDRWLRWTLGDSAERAAFRSRLLDENAFYWLSARARHKPMMVWALLGAAACVWCWFWFKFGSDWVNPITYVITALALNSILKVWFANETCAQLSEDRRTGTLELLLSTPLSVQDVIRGQGLALARQFLAPVVAVVILEIIFLVAGMQHHELRGGDSSYWVLMWIFGLVMLLADLVALFYLCLWKSLTARSASRASSMGIVRILALPWIIFSVFLLSMGMAGGGIGGDGIMIFWLFIGLGVDIFFWISSKVQLESRFREVATTRYSQSASVWNRLFGSGSPEKANRT